MHEPLVIAIGGRTIALTLEGAAGELGRHARERYRGFLPATGEAGPAERSFALGIRVDAGRRPPGWHPVHVTNPPVDASGDLSRAVVRGVGLEAELDWDAGRGEATIPDSLSHLDLLVRVTLGGELLRQGSTFLHAAGVILDGFAVAFAGPSGAGKSTIAALCRREGLPVLCDEMLAVLHHPSALRFRGTPFWNGSDREGPAGGVFLLEHGPEPVVQHVSPDRALPYLVAAGGCPLDLPAFQEAFFAALGNLLRRCPPYRLVFRPDRSFLAAIRALPEFAFFAPRREARHLPRHPGRTR